MDIFQASWSALQAEAAAYPWGVQIWMRVMAVSFAIGIVFAPWKSGARWMVAALAVNIFGLIAVKAAFPELSRTEIGTVIHLIFWSFALLMIWKPEARIRLKAAPASGLNRIYLIWLVGASGVMAASLVLDAITAAKILF
ncbi:hypothetical protein A8B75_07785 [Sphingomonadales bacterium EhC05]|uniref:hypothetical protein n=1 Tax=Parasphingorhabdus sp. TaxID=2709688 RepID=UPI0007F454D9|nr:hypothetical protein A8B75_07785 [Sphingomonadales bacterium EhC05]